MTQHGFIGQYEGETPETQRHAREELDAHGIRAELEQMLGKVRRAADCLPALETAIPGSTEPASATIQIVSGMIVQEVLSDLSSGIAKLLELAEQKVGKLEHRVPRPKAMEPKPNVRDRVEATASKLLAAIDGEIGLASPNADTVEVLARAVASLACWPNMNPLTVEDYRKLAEYEVAKAVERLEAGT